MILDAKSLTTLQSCPRRTLLDSDYEVLLLRPKQLFDGCIRKGILAISNGADPAIVSADLSADLSSNVPAYVSADLSAYVPTDLPA